MLYENHRYAQPSITGSDLIIMFRQHGSHLLHSCRPIRVVNTPPCLWAISVICFRHILASSVKNTWKACTRSSFQMLFHSPRSLPSFPFHPSCRHSLSQNWALMYSNLNKNLIGGSSRERRRHGKRSTACSTKTLS